MLWPGGPFHFIGPITVPVKDRKAAAKWYEVVLNLNGTIGWDMIPTGMYNPTDAANPEPQIVFVSAADAPLGPTPTKHPIIFARNIEGEHRWFTNQTATTGPLQTDSAGNRFFDFRDLDGNVIEVCHDTNS